MQGTSLKYFMWAYQHHTQGNIQRYAEKLFEEISPKLKPQVFLLGVLREKKDSKCIQYPICIQPEECGIDVNQFTDVDNLAKSILEKDPRQNIMHGMQIMQQMQDDQMKRDSLRRAVQQLVDKNFQGKKIVSFVSQSVFLEGYEIFVVLQFDEDTYNSFYHLNAKNNLSRKSLLDSVIWVLLGESLDTMYRPRASAYSQEISTDKKEILRIAASEFIGSVIFTASKAHGTWEFFNICNYISSLKYEGDASVGKMIICKEDHPNLDIALKLTTPIGLGEFRKVRKLLEIASENLFLYSNGNEILGIAKQKGTYDAKNEDLLIVNFRGSHKWELIHDNNIMMIVEYTNPNIPKFKINKEIFDDLLQRIFQGISENDMNQLLEIVNIAIDQKHGTLLIISEDAKIESKRLENQSTNILPSMLNKDLIKNVTSIDGAVLLDRHGVCHSIGVILDGVATNKGTSARGARYNSAIRYVEINKKKCVAVIISEDGMVDLYPNLNPQILKSSIEQKIIKLRREVELETVDYNKYRPLMNWFNDHKFYLSQEQCDTINNLKREFDSKLKMEPNAIYLVYHDLSSNPEMDNSYFIEE